ncbi:MAG: type II secretion system protein [Clostridia bacterium]
MLKLRKNKKGFSLVELIVVIAIMAILAGVVGGAMFGQLNKQKDSSADSEAKALASSIGQALAAQASNDDGLTVATMKTALDEWQVDNSEAVAVGALVASTTIQAPGDTEKAGSHKFVVTYDSAKFEVIIAYKGVKTKSTLGYLIECDPTTGVFKVSKGAAWSAPAKS